MACASGIDTRAFRRQRSAPNRGACPRTCLHAYARELPPSHPPRAHRAAGPPRRRKCQRDCHALAIVSSRVVPATFRCQRNAPNCDAWPRTGSRTYRGPHVLGFRRRASVSGSSFSPCEPRSRFLLCRALSGGSLRVGDYVYPLRVRRGLGLVVVVPVPPLVWRRLGVALG